MSNSGIYKIIKIVDEYNVLINAGSAQLIKIGDVLEVFIEGEEVIDPETKKPLGTLDTIKAKLVVKQVYEYFSVCGNYETINKSLTYVLGNATLKSEPKRLNVDSSQISGGIQEEESKIRIGDLVRKSL